MGKMKRFSQLILIACILASFIAQSFGQVKADWISDDDENHFLVKDKTTNTWIEFQNGEKIAEFSPNPEDSTLFEDLDNNRFLRIKGETVSISDNLEDLDTPEKVLNGHWTNRGPGNANVVCGRRRVIEEKSGDRIINLVLGGTNSEPYTWPWQVYIESKFDNSPTFGYWCSGALITNEWIVTTASCLSALIKEEKETIRISLGIYEGKKDITDENRILASQLIEHPNYELNDGRSNNNIALVKLSRPVEFTDKIQPICLPTTNLALPGQSGILTGWRKFPENEFDDKLQEAEIPILEPSVCELSTTQESQQQKICAGDTNPSNPKGLCFDDRASLLVKQVDNSNEQFAFVGIANYPLNFNQCDGRSVFTNVASYLDWIKEIVPDIFTINDNQNENEKKEEETNKEDPLVDSGESEQEQSEEDEEPTRVLDITAVKPPSTKPVTTTTKKPPSIVTIKPDGNDSGSGERRGRGSRNRSRIQAKG